MASFDAGASRDSAAALSGMRVSAMGHWGHFLVMMAVFVVVAVLARAIAPLFRSLGLLIALIGAAIGALVAVMALGTAIFAGVAGWAGWNQTSGHAAAAGQPAPLAMAVIGGVAAATVLLAAGFAFRLWRRKQGGTPPQRERQD